MTKLAIKQHDDDTVTIEGTRYANSFFRELGCAFPDLIGQVLRVDRKEDGVVWLSREGSVTETYMQRVDTSEPGLFVIRLREQVTMEVLDRLKATLEKALNKLAEGSEVLIFGPEVDSITTKNERY